MRNRLAVVTLTTSATASVRECFLPVRSARKDVYKRQLTDTELVITKGKTGIGPDMDALKEAILKAISIEDYEAVIECPTMKTRCV